MGFKNIVAPDMDFSKLEGSKVNGIVGEITYLSITLILTTILNVFTTKKTDLLK